MTTNTHVIPTTPAPDGTFYCLRCGDATMPMTDDRCEAVSHAHIAITSRDCDSTYENDYVAQRHDDEDEWDFRSRIIGGMVSFSGFGGTLTVEHDPDDHDDLGTAEWSESTEEGFRHAHARFCNDDCDTGERRYRDRTAEAMGY